MALRADDGTELPIKEGVILDPQETVVLYSGEEKNNSQSSEDTSRNSSGSVRVFRMGFWGIPLLAAGLILTFVLGTFVLTAAAALFFIFLIVRTILSFFRVRP